METLYDALGVDPDADREEIRRAYREAAKRHHPDGSEGDAERFRQLTTARDVLLDRDRRSRYDALGHRRYARHHLGDEWPAGEPSSGGRRSRTNSASATVRTRRSRRSGRTQKARRTRDPRGDSPRRSGPADGVVALETYWPIAVRAGLLLLALLALAFVLETLSV